MAYRPFLSDHRYILIAGFLSLVTYDVTLAMTSSLWNNVGKHTVTSSMVTINTSRVASRCVMECRQMGGCVSVALDPASDICYLQPTFRPARQGDDGPPLHVYVMDEVSECKPSEAPDVANAHVTKWRVTPSSLDGDVSCVEDYMLSAEETPQVRCQLDKGGWTTLMNATCRQFAWRNNTGVPARCSLPRPAAVGLCVRVKGTPTQNTRFTIDLRTSGDNIVLHVKPKLNTAVKNTLVNYKQGTWNSRKRIILTDPSPPFPFAVGVHFEMAITAVSMYKFSLQVNGAHYGDFTGGLPVTDVVKVYVDLDVSLEHLIIGC